MEIRQARTAREIEWSRLLFKEYAAWLGIDLSFQGFEAELAGLPGVYRRRTADCFLRLRQMKLQVVLHCDRRRTVFVR